MKYLFWWEIWDGSHLKIQSSDLRLRCLVFTALKSFVRSQRYLTLLPVSEAVTHMWLVTLVTENARDVFCFGFSYSEEKMAFLSQIILNNPWSYIYTYWNIKLLFYFLNQVPLLLAIAWVAAWLSTICAQ